MGITSNTTESIISVGVGDRPQIRIKVRHGKLTINREDLHKALGLPDTKTKDVAFKGAIQIAFRSNSEYGTVVAIALGTLNEKYPYFKIRYT